MKDFDMEFNAALDDIIADLFNHVDDEEGTLHCTFRNISNDVAVPVKSYIDFKNMQYVVLLDNGIKLTSTYFKGDDWDEYVAFCICMSKYFFGSSTSARKFMKDISMVESQRKKLYNRSTEESFKNTMTVKDKEPKQSKVNKQIKKTKQIKNKK